MSLVLELPAQLEAELAAEAARLGQTLPEYALRLLTEACGSRARTGAELVAYWQREGLLGTRTDVTDAPAHARALREQAQRRERS